MLLKVQNLHFSYGAEQPLFANLNLNIDHGSILALAGESGCGKSTLLKLIYGLLNWESGKIIFEGRELLGPKGNIVPGEPAMNWVAQDYDLMPYSTVYDNVGKFLSNINLSEKRAKVMELLEVVGMQEYADVKPNVLSGGQQQRVAIARALSVMPKLLLLDEPFSNLDFSRKVELRERLFNYVAQHRISLIISTHEIQEVLPWLHRIVVLQDGRLIQNDSAEETYRNPYNAYVAKLFGEVNVLDGLQKNKLGLSKNFWYPSDITESSNGLSAEVLDSRFAGSHFWTKIAVGDITLVMYTPKQVSGPITVRFNES